VVASKRDNTLAEDTFMRNSEHWLEYNSKLLSASRKPTAIQMRKTQQQGWAEHRFTQSGRRHRVLRKL